MATVQHLIDAILGGTLLLSAAAKLAAPAATSRALATFGVRRPAPRRIAWSAAVALEVALGAGVAAGLAPARYAAAAMLLAFAALLVRALRAGRGGQPCGCLGARSRVSAGAVARNVALAAALLAAPPIARAGVSAEHWLEIGLGVALAGVAVLALAVVALARELGELRLSMAPQLALDVDGEGPAPGERVGLIDRFSPGDRALFAVAVFSSAGCPMCRALEPAVTQLARDPLLAVEVFDEHDDRAAWRALAIPGSPYAVVLDLDGTVLAKGTFNSFGQLQGLVAGAEQRTRGAAGVA